MAPGRHLSAAGHSEHHGNNVWFGLLAYACFEVCWGSHCAGTFDYCQSENPGSGHLCTESEADHLEGETGSWWEKTVARNVWSLNKHPGKIQSKLRPHSAE